MARKVTVINTRPTVMAIGKTGIMLAPGDTADVDPDDLKIKSAIAKGTLAVRSNSVKQAVAPIAEPEVSVETESAAKVSSTDLEGNDDEPDSAPVRKTLKPKEG